MFRRIALAAGLLAVSSAAQASFILIDNYAPDDTTIGVVSNNNFKTQLAALGVTTYVLGASLGVSQNGWLDLYYYGKEAGYRNTFSANGGDAFYNTGTNPTFQDKFNAPIYFGSVEVDAGRLQFRFCAYSGGTQIGCLSNAANDTRGINSFQSIAYNISGNNAWLLWDDSGAGPDDNHDDMVIRATFRSRSVTEPGTLALAGLGLIGLAFARRRR